MSIKHGANIFDLCEMYGVNKNELMDFSSNINPFGSSKKAKDYIIENIDMVSLYPDPEYKKLKNSISAYCNASKENILLGSGATELISSFIETINPKNALLLSPSYSEYEKELNKINCSTDMYFAKEELDFKIDTTDFINKINSKNYDLIIICNPNNPTGFAFDRKDLDELLSKTDTYIMVDETYIEFTDMAKFSSTDLIDKFSKLFVIRGTSKFFGTPGIRLGYGLISDKNIFSAMEKSLDLWNVNIFATLMGEIMFTDKDYIEETSKKLKKEREYLLKELNSISSLKVFNTFGNFILCDLKNKSLTARELYEKLVKDKIIIRDCASFDGLSEFYFRVCILKPNENKLLIESLKKILN
ncbi:histidinol-phosphate transaminase [uncultured Clostridium sp.]|jgi:threonine-phosphate decarboxylase|uniref:pyridoxal phosphate-dependent aminotransferase n=1 Tax=uncultured Clostridium sp. TaxID=59620 RepID=UPI002610429F|nr:histidinol-phosphate transaminase [uncultured Clostridium sp.]